MMRPWAMMMLLLGCLMGLAACDGDPTTTADTQQDDTGVADTGPTPDTNIPTDTGTPDTGTDDTGAPDTMVDTGPDPNDLDGDLIPDNRDNCLGLANSTQADGDGDGLGDACDACPTIWDPNNNAVACDPIPEQEPNEFVNTMELEIPFTVTGFIGDYAAAQNQLGDMDVFSFQAKAGQLLRVDLSAENSRCYCVLQIEKISGNDFIRVLITPNGTKDFREFFVPYDGEYYLFFYDLLNAQPVPGQAGSPDHTYTACVYPVPIEPLEQDSFPIAYSGGNDKKVRFTRTTLPTDRIIRAEATSSPLIDNSLHPPALVVWDPTLEATVAAVEPATTTSTDVRLISPPTPSGEVLFVEDFQITWQVNTVTVVAQLEESIGELEPNGSVSTATPIATNTDVKGRIDSNGESDYFVFAAPATKRISVRVTDTGGSFSPRISLGRDRIFFMDELLSNRGELLEYLTAGPETLLIRVRDANSASGPDHTYTVHVDVTDPVPTPAGALPVDTQGVFDPNGAHLLYSVDLPALTPHEITLVGQNYTNGAEVIRVVDPATARLLGEAEQASTAVASPTDATVWVDLGVMDGTGGPTSSVNIKVEPLAVTEPGSLPFNEMVSLEADELRYYAVDMAVDEVLSVFMTERTFSPDIAILDAGTFEEIKDSFQSYLYYENDTGAAQRVIVALRNRSGSAGNARFSLHTQVPEALTLPASQAGNIAAEMSGGLYWLDLDVGNLLEVSATSSDGAFVPNIALVNRTLTSRIRTQAGVPLAYISTSSQRVLVDVRDDNAAGPFDYTLDAAILDPATSTLPISETGTLDATTPQRIFKLSLTENQVLDINVSTAGFAPRVELRDAESGLTIMTVSGADPPSIGRFNFASSEAILIFRDDASSFGAGFDYTLNVQELTPTVVGEVAGDNDSIGTAQVLTDAPPLRVTGRLLSGDRDFYAITLQPGETLRAYTTYSQLPSEIMYTIVDLYEDGTGVTSDLFSGENNFSGSVIYTNETGAATTYQIEIDSLTSVTSLPYSLLIFVE